MFICLSSVVTLALLSLLLLLSFSHGLLLHFRRRYSRLPYVRHPISATFTLLLPHLMPSSFLYPKVIPPLRVVGQSLHIIIRSGRITLTQVLTVSFAVVLCSGRIRACASAFPITKAFVHAAIDNPFLLYYISY